MSYKLDLHTHSFGSPDGGLKLHDYRYFLENNLLDYIAITDHGSIATAQNLQVELGEYGRRIIIGQEIMTTKGELVGLYLNGPIADGLSPLEAATQIHAQGGLVYVPHPFETARSGLQTLDLNQIEGQVDIVEVFNGRAIFQNRSSTARLWASQNLKPGAVSSDAHGRFGWGYTYTVVHHAPNRENLQRILASCTYSTRNVGWGIFYPKLNRLKKALKL